MTFILDDMECGNHQVFDDLTGWDVETVVDFILLKKLVFNVVYKIVMQNVFLQKK